MTIDALLTRVSLLVALAVPLEGSVAQEVDRYRSSLRDTPWRYYGAAGGMTTVQRSGLPTEVAMGDFSPRPSNYNFDFSRGADRAALRDVALVNAVLRIPPAIPYNLANLFTGDIGPHDFQHDEEVYCILSFDRDDFGRIEPTRGMTPKFDCVLQGGEKIKVKFSKDDQTGEARIPGLNLPRGTNTEVHTEVIVTRLFKALGYGADVVTPLAKLRCFGCAENPVEQTACMALYSHTRRVGFGVRKEECDDKYGHLVRGRFPNAYVMYQDSQLAQTGVLREYVDFDLVVIERRYRGPDGRAQRIRAFDRQGWALTDVENMINVPRVEKDAFYLLTGFIEHYDSKPEQQRLLCLDPEDGVCGQPLAIVQDLGATLGSGNWLHAVFNSFQEAKLNLGNWLHMDEDELARWVRSGDRRAWVRDDPDRSSVWKDGEACVSDATAQFQLNRTHVPRLISEEGRQLFLSFFDPDRGGITDEQLRNLLSGAKIEQYGNSLMIDGLPYGLQSDVWVDAFRFKLGEIISTVCPTIEEIGASREGSSP